MFCVCRDGSLKLIEIATKKIIRTYEGHKVNVIKKTPCGKKLIIGSKDGSIKILNSENGDCIIDGVKLLIFHKIMLGLKIFLSLIIILFCHYYFAMKNINCLICMTMLVFKHLVSR
jgi:WD40 repeat protein